MSTLSNYSEAELETEIAVKLTLRDLLILSWGHESVSFVPGEKSDNEFKAAERKIDHALDQLRGQLSRTQRSNIMVDEAHRAPQFSADAIQTVLKTISRN
ncbi:hypothetical protein [Pseudomonas asiatica]|uniref:hypothetical protein n=1 Tax=Pseudomonas asiatica TaxID=2219225 RepID=UPI0010C0AB54|nr:hypothetical protein [Pseudomonas asiatica]